MSWDLVVFGPIDPESDPDTGRAILTDWGASGLPVIGSEKEIRARISHALPGIHWGVEFGEVSDGDGSIRVNLRDRDRLVSNFMLFCHGCPARRIALLSDATGWRILDLSSRKWIADLDHLREGQSRMVGMCDRWST